MVARRGGFAPGLIYYHFPDLQALLLAVLEQASESRLQRYREVIEPAASVVELAAALTDLYREDVESGHVKAVQEIVAGTSAAPEAGARVMELLQPWFDFAETTIRRMVADTPVESLVPVRDAGYAAVALYMGMETMTHLEGGRDSSERLLAALRDLAPLADALRAGGG